MTARIDQTTLAETGARSVSPSVAARGDAALHAPFSLRCGAMLLDYTLVIAILAFATILARVFDRGTASETVLFFGYLSAAAAFVLNFVVLTSLSGRTLGKWATGLRVEQSNGQPLSIGRAMLRHLVGYPLSVLTLGIGFLIAAFSAEGLALHDRLAGTVVVRGTLRPRGARSPRTSRGVRKV